MSSLFPNIFCFFVLSASRADVLCGDADWHYLKILQASVPQAVESLDDVERNEYQKVEPQGNSLFPLESAILADEIVGAEWTNPLRAVIVLADFIPLLEGNSFLHCKLTFRSLTCVLIIPKPKPKIKWK